MKKYTIALCALIMTTGFDIQSGGERKAVIFSTEVKAADGPSSPDAFTRIENRQQFQNAIAAQEASQLEEWSELGTDPYTRPFGKPANLKPKKTKPSSEFKGPLSFKERNIDVNALSQILSQGSGNIRNYVESILELSKRYKENKFSLELKNILNNIANFALDDYSPDPLKRKITVAQRDVDLPLDASHYEQDPEGNPTQLHTIPSGTIRSKDKDDNPIIIYIDWNQLFKTKRNNILPGMLIELQNLTGLLREINSNYKDRLSIIDTNVQFLYDDLRSSRNGDELITKLPGFFKEMIVVLTQLNPIIQRALAEAEELWSSDLEEISRWSKKGNVKGIDPSAPQKPPADSQMSTKRRPEGSMSVRPQEMATKHRPANLNPSTSMAPAMETTGTTKYGPGSNNPIESMDVRPPEMATKNRPANQPLPGAGLTVDYEEYIKNPDKYKGATVRRPKREIT